MQSESVRTEVKTSMFRNQECSMKSLDLFQNDFDVISIFIIELKFHLSKLNIPFNNLAYEIFAW